MIDNVNIDQVSSFRYLGTVIDNKLSFSENTSFVCKKAHQRLYLLRKLKSFRVSDHILESVYRSLIESILTFNVIVWFGLLTVKDKARLARVIKIASKVVGVQQKQLSDLHASAIRKKACRIMQDVSHPLNHCFEMLPSGRRLNVPRARKNIHKKSFIPSAIAVLNSR